MKFSLSDNQPPTARAASSNPRGNAPWTFTLDGSGSTDPDGFIAAHQWSVGNHVLGDTPINTTTFPEGSFVVRLTVTDDLGRRGTDETLVDVRATEPDPDLVAWWRFDETAALASFDSSGNTHHEMSNSTRCLSTDAW